jgi:aspartyl/asparaginyl beta-hydroxylase (cupin superfamily)
MNVSSPYYTFLHSREELKDESTFFDATQFPWTSDIENNWKMIRDEICTYLENEGNALKPYYADEMMNAPKKWKAFSFYFWGTTQSKKAISNCPRTISLLRKIPGLSSASVSVMEPQSEIKPHYGDTNAIYRCHLPLVVPATLPACGIRVAYEDRSWETGRLLIFNDAAYHKAWNHTNQRRIVLIFDVIRPEFSSQKEWICSRVYGYLFFQMMNKALRLFRNEKNPLAKSICFMNSLVFRARFYFLKRKSPWL